VTITKVTGYCPYGHTVGDKHGYAFLLDREGSIRWEGQGFSIPETLKEFFETAERLAT
jgi:hypothetical protein